MRPPDCTTCQKSRWPACQSQSGKWHCGYCLRPKGGYPCCSNCGALTWDGWNHTPTHKREWWCHNCWTQDEDSGSLLWQEWFDIRRSKFPKEFENGGPDLSPGNFRGKEKTEVAKEEALDKDEAVVITDFGDNVKKEEFTDEEDEVRAELELETERLEEELSSTLSNASKEALQNMPLPIKHEALTRFLQEKERLERSLLQQPEPMEILASSEEEEEAPVEARLCGEECVDEEESYPEAKDEMKEEENDMTLMDI